MEPSRQSPRTDLIQIGQLPQMVPSRVCLTCDVCCRFPEADSFLRPYFTAQEILHALSQGIDPEAFPDHRGSQIRVIPNPGGEGYLCPAFDPATSRCRIYEGRPLDCQIYPLTVMWSADGTEVVLGWDRKCPFLEERSGFDVRGSRFGERGWVSEAEGESIEEYAQKIAALVEREDMVETFVRHPRLIGRFQDDVVVIRTLPRLTERLRRSSSFLKPRTSNLKLRTPLPLTPADYPRFQVALAAVDTPLAAYALAPHLIWRDLFAYSWTEYEGRLCLFAEYADGIFMPVPPLGPGSLKEPLSRAWAWMTERNQGSGVSRVENVPEEWKAEWEAWGYRLRPKDSDYLYAAKELVELRGDPYKSPRAACNRFSREHRYRYEVYDAPRDREACLDLYRRWRGQKEAGGMERIAAMMLDDAEAAHRIAMSETRPLELIGRVIYVNDRLIAYTFGYFRSPSVFCVLLEVADRAMPGLSSCLFREFCREAQRHGAILINTLDDSGLDTLRQAKRAYRPTRLVPSFIATEGIF